MTIHHPLSLLFHAWTYWGFQKDDREWRFSTLMVPISPRSVYLKFELGSIHGRATSRSENLSYILFISPWPLPSSHMSHFFHPHRVPNIFHYILSTQKTPFFALTYQKDGRLPNSRAFHLILELGPGSGKVVVELSGQITWLGLVQIWLRWVCFVLVSVRG